MSSGADMLAASLPVVLTLDELRRENDEMVTLYFPVPDPVEAAAQGLDLAAFVPGRFFMVWLPRLDEKPYAVSYLSEERVAITVQQRGPFSTALTDLAPGARVGLRGPFGRGFRGADKYDPSRVAIIGGGCGMAVLAPLARQLPQAAVVCGARSSSLILCPEGIEDQVVFTDDGSAGRQGYPVEWLVEQAEAEAVDAVYTCGPEVMLAAAARACREAGIACQAGLERYMKCGIGVCGQCECDGQRVCVEGPVFDLADLERMPSFARWRRDKTGRPVVPDHCPAGPDAGP